MSPQDRAEIDAVAAPLFRSLADMDQAISRAGFGHFLDLIEDGETSLALKLYAGGIDPDFDSATTGFCS